MNQAAAKVDKKKHARNEFVDTIVVIVEALIIAVLFRTFLFQPFSIPTGSMQSTLMIGDYFVASKFSYGYGKYSFVVPLPFNGRLFGSTPQQGDVAVFHNEVSGEDYIKRVIGMPGDRVQMQNGRLIINGTMVERELVGEVLDRDSSNRDVPVQVYRETLPSGVVHTIQEVSDDQPLDNTAEYVVPQGHYFMMGDNRDRSQDSRVLSAVGYVPLDNFIGKAEARFFSVKDNRAPWAVWEWPETLRLDRMFQSVYQ
jgi:signal peptidase I